MKQRAFTLFVGLAVVVVTALPARAASFGWFGNSADGNPAGAITASGNTPVELAGLSATDLAGISVLWVLNGDNGAPPAELVANASAVADFVAAGGVLSYHDRYVSEADPASSANNKLLPGAGGIAFIRDLFTDPANIDIINAGTAVTKGLDNNSLDGGTPSSNGYVLLLSLPASAVAILSQTDPEHIVDFYYQYGTGFVYYSTIPLDYYFGGGGPNPPHDNFVDLYAVNEAGFQASLNAVPEAVPEPTSLAFLGLGLLGLAVRRRFDRG